MSLLTTKSLNFMSTSQKPYKLCFYCEYPVVENDRILISSITHAGLKNNIIYSHKNKLGLVGNVVAYESNLMHLHCYDKIVSELELQ